MADDATSFLEKRGGAAATAAAAAQAANAAANANRGGPPSRVQPSGFGGGLDFSGSTLTTAEPMRIPLPEGQPDAGPKRNTGRGSGKTPQNRSKHSLTQPDFSDPSLGGCGLMGGMPWVSYPGGPPAGGMPHAPPFMPPPFMMQGYPGYSPYPMWPPAVPGMPPMYMGGMPGMQPTPVSQSGAHARNKNQGGGAGGGRGGGAGGGKDGGASKENNQRKRRGKAKGAKDREPSPSLDDDSIERSEALKEVRRSGSSKSALTLEQALPHVLEFARDQHGSRFLQAKLDEATPEDKEKVFQAICSETAALANDVFGNFVIQKLFDIGTAEQKKAMALKLQPHIVQLSKEAYGCRVIQKAITAVSKESQLHLAQELKKDVISLIENMHGNHVIQKCIEQMPPDSVVFIIESVQERTEAMAVHSYGCRVIQRLLEHCDSQKLHGMLEMILQENTVRKLAMDPYGNYVVQHMLEHGRLEDKKRIIETIQRDIVNFAKNKCSSNVAEKCFEIATIGEHAAQLETERSALMNKVIGAPGEMGTPLHQITDDKFGNYIVQRILEHSRGPERDRIRSSLEQIKGPLESSANGKHILNALKKEFGGE
eukprot:TRINITY_DN2789_c0_g1_i1.p1 TRINITY_DN2789_c0_g1~~TRINITY_DN2789_c0_g1_i1.p1  ORF type:complete len:596 (-),score=144.62 TRINITY_DN2789_c0_g1_i1:288-2075(-)